MKTEQKIKKIIFLSKNNFFNSLDLFLDLENPLFLDICLKIRNLKETLLKHLIIIFKKASDSYLGTLTSLKKLNELKFRFCMLLNKLSY